MLRELLLPLDWLLVLSVRGDGDGGLEITDADEDDEGGWGAFLPLLFRSLVLATGLLVEESAPYRPVNMKGYDKPIAAM